jgi:aminoglycoside/choline kinase family phosphotransferase
MENITSHLSSLFLQWSGHRPDAVVALPPAGSQRRYFRLACGDISAIGAWNPDKEENRAFLYFSRHFKQKGLHVPEVYAENHDQDIYLIEDLGDISLYSLLEKQPESSGFNEDIIPLYQKSLKELVNFQISGGKGLDYNYCYPYDTLDARSINWDLNYFKYYFLKPHVAFHEDRLEEDFLALSGFLTMAGADHFMYRDFQSRNILIRDGQPYFIDYQGGRKGPLQYDVASLLFQVKADLPDVIREELLEFYLDEIQKHVRVDRNLFLEHYHGFVLLRLLQVLGAYGFRGLIEKKPHFLTSIPFALKHLRWWLDHFSLPIDMPELITALDKLTGIRKYSFQLKGETDKLIVTINSFSYRAGIPEDMSGNGGGFVFDCRALPNPGREKRYRVFTGKDQVIIDYLKDEAAVIRFLDEAEKILSLSIDNYKERGFGNLAVNFGCTGGRHRSVYCTETMAGRLKMKYPDVIVDVEHKMI